MEKLANCNVTISDHEAGWAVDVPAYNKHGGRDLKVHKLYTQLLFDFNEYAFIFWSLFFTKSSGDTQAQCSTAANNKLHVSVYPSGEEATVEFDADEMLQACQSGSLRPPVLSLFCPDASSALGYRHMNVYDRSV